MKPHITMRDIAKELGVSVVTVSKALGDKEGVGEELRRRIKELAQERGYRPNAMAKSMKEGSSYNIGIVIAERFTGVVQSFYLQFYHQLTKMLEESQFSGILTLLSQEDEEELVLPRIYYEKKVDGFILLGQLGKEYIQAFQETGVPLVLLDFYTDQQVDCVVTDNFHGVYEMTNYLIEQGHRDIAFVGNLHSTSSIQDRFLGYYKSLLEHRIPVRPEWVLNDRDDKGRYVDIELPEHRPSAIVCNCDQVAYHLMGMLRKQGIRVPEDCSIVGFDNDIYASLCEPALTTVEVNIQEMARTAVKIMLKKVKNHTRQYGRVLVKGRFMVRESVRQIENMRS